VRLRFTFATVPQRRTRTRESKEHSLTTISPTGTTPRDVTGARPVSVSKRLAYDAGVGCTRPRSTEPTQHLHQSLLGPDWRDRGSRHGVALLREKGNIITTAMMRTCARLFFGMGKALFSFYDAEMN
jgi:hypothetical protein